MKCPKVTYPMFQLASVLLMATAFATDYYVSPAGDDQHDGLAANPAHALRSIQRGVDLLRAGDRLFVRAGTYRETVTFAHDGEPGAAIVVMAYPSEEPVISGLEQLAEWRPIGGDRWTTTMSWTLGVGRDQLFMAGQPLLEARHPNAAKPGFELRDEKGAELPPPWPRFAAFAIPDYDKPFTVKLPPGESQAAGWWEGALYVGWHWDGWQAQCGIVTSSAGDTLQVRTDLARGWWYPSDRPLGGGIEERGRGMLVGHIHALDAPGEWVRAADGTVTLQLAPGGAPAGIEAKRRQLALDLSGRRHIEVRGLRVFGASAKLRESQACTIASCLFEWISHFTNFAGVTGDILPLAGFEPAYDGETGIYVCGVGNTVRDSVLRWSAGSGVILDGFGHTIHNCLIEHAGYAGSYLGSIWIFGDQYRLSGGHRITRNTLRYSPRELIGYFGVHQNSPSDQAQPYAASLIEGNHIHTGMVIAHDGGMLYWTDVDGGGWTGRRTLIRRNVVHDCRDWVGAAPIYLDAGCWNFEVRENLVWAAPGTMTRPIFFSPPSVGCLRADNAFTITASRDATKLQAADFPNGVPFAFGHDLVNPPAVPAWSPAREWSVAAVRRRAQSSNVTLAGPALVGWRDGDWATFEVPRLAAWSAIVVTAKCGDSYLPNLSRLWPPPPRHVRTADPLVLACYSAEERSGDVYSFAQSATGLRNGSWMRFKDVALGAGFRQVRIGYASNNPSEKRAELRLDRLDGPVVASIPLPVASGIVEPPSGRPIPTVMTTGSLAANATGKHDLYFVIVGEETGELVDIYQALLENYRGTIPLAADEVRLEVRANDRNGPLLVTLFPGYNGEAFDVGAILDWPGALDSEAVPGNSHRVCLVVRTALADPELRVFGVRFQRAAN